MRKRMNQFLSLLIVATLLLGMLPALAFAQDGAPSGTGDAPVVGTQDEATPTPAPQADQAPEPPAPGEGSAPTPKPDLSQAPQPTDTPEPTVSENPAGSVEPEASATPETSVEPEASTTPEASVEPEASVTPEVSATPEAPLPPVLEGFALRLDENGIAIVGYSGGDEAVVPAAVDDVPVVLIATGAFADQPSLQSVTVAEGVLSV